MNASVRYFGSAELKEMARPGYLLLNCAVQKYAWGKIGASSAVAQLSEGNPGFELDPEAPYAEVMSESDGIAFVLLSLSRRMLCVATPISL